MLHIGGRPDSTGSPYTAERCIRPGPTSPSWSAFKDPQPAFQGVRCDTLRNDPFIWCLMCSVRNRGADALYSVRDA